MDYVGLRAVARRTLLVSLVFGAVSAVAGAVLGVAFNGAGVPLAYLEGTPFSSYLVPGLILGVVVGGTQALAAITVLRRNPFAPGAASVAGFGMIIWIVVELAIVSEYSFLQAIYVALGIAQLGLVLVMTGALRSGTSDPVRSGSRRRDSRQGLPSEPRRT